MASIYNKLQIRRGLENDFNLANPILSSGEPAFATDTNVLKIGNGIDRWQSLISFSNSSDISNLSGILKNYTDLQVANLIDGAPDLLNTLNEIAAAINDDENFASTFIASGTQFLNNLDSVSGVLQTQIDDLESSSSSNLVSVSGNLQSQIDATDLNLTTTSGNLQSQIDDNTNCCVTASGSLQEQIDAIEAAYISSVFDDKAPYLGGDLCLNGHNITCSGNIETTGVISSNSGIFDVVSFNTNDESVLSKGQISWDDTEGTMDIGLTDNTTIHIGEHRYFRVRNQNLTTLYKGQVVYATGVHSNGLITPSLYVADGSIREVRFMGVVLEDINSNSNGYVIDFGHLHDMDLDGSATNYAVGDETWNNGDILYVHPTQAGKLTNVEPTHSISTAIILNTGHGTGGGRIFVRPQSYGHLNDNHDISITSPASGDGLIYNSSSSSWENVTVPKSDISGITGVASGVYNIVVVSSGTYDSITNKDPNTIYFVP